MTSVKYFHNGMSGAPSLAKVAGNLISVLDACLVDGFGLQTANSVTVSGGVGTATLPSNMVCSKGMVLLFAGATGTYVALNGERKVTADSTATVVQFDATGLADGTVSGTVTVKFAPAGWVKAFSGTNEAAYKSANVQASGSYLKVTDTATTVATVRGYEAMSSLSSGTGIFPTVVQATNSYWPKSDSAAVKNWYIIANDKFFYFGVAYRSDYTTGYALYGFGDIIPKRSADPYRATLFAVNTDPTASGLYLSDSYQPVACTTAGNNLRYAQRSYTGLVNPAALTPNWLDQSVQSGRSGSGGRTFPNPADNGIFFSPFLLLEGSGFRGELPGCFAAPQNTKDSIAHATRIDSVPNFQRDVMYFQLMYQNTPVWGGVFFDLTGPWGN